MTLSASKRFERGCARKRRYQSLVQAERYVVGFAVTGVAEGLEAYECEFCGFFHLGHPNRRWTEPARADAAN